MRKSFSQFLLLLTFLLPLSFCSAAVPAPLTDVFNGGRGTSFNEGWKFYLGDISSAYLKTYNDASWRQLTLPHDWSIELPFRRNSPSTGSGGYLDGGTGWYRKTFTLPQNYAGKRITIQFEGVYMNSTVYVNGNLVGNRPYGYSTFQYDITPYVTTGSGTNVIAVKVVNKQPSSRWYSGSGIYRNVWLTVTNPVHVAYCGNSVTTTSVSTASATVTASTILQNQSTASKTVSVITSVYDKFRNLVTAHVSAPLAIPANSDSSYVYSFKLPNPVLWSMSDPYLYTLKTQIVDQNKVLDTYNTAFGVRTIAVGGSFGFKLNGVQTKLRGVCMHHDLGSLGAAQNYRALERQVEILKSFGCNAIRTSHNPPAPALLEICDRLGVVVVNEAFDMWETNKSTYDYANYFSEWARTDIQDFVRRDRNHPCVVMWSIGNEIPEQSNDAGYAIARNLISWVRAVDPTRPVTNAMNQGQHYKLGPILDVVGYNYDPASTYSNDHTRYPNWVIMGSETSSAIRTRGVYHLPINENNQNSPDMQCSSYDNTVVGWGQSAEDSWTQDKIRPYVVGQFIWTGFDYIGEPTPYGWPAKSSYFGIVDMCGFPKDIYYFYQSQWTTTPMVHLLPHWNWEKGDTIPVWAYSNCDSVKLEFNGISKGTQRMKSYKPFHAEWIIPFEAGKIKAYGYKKGLVVAVDSILTAGSASQIELKADRTIIDADGKDQVFIETNVLDENGTLVPHAANQIIYSVFGPGKVVGVDNGNPLSLESFKASTRQAFNGKCLAIVQSTGGEGQITVTATTPPILKNIALNKPANADSEDLFTPTNIALGKKSYSDSFQPDRPVYMANDGNPGTRWCALNGNTGHWWMVDLGSVRSLTGTEIMWEGTNAYQYKIEISSDSIDWTVAVDKTANAVSAQVMVDDFARSARYVRITVTGNLTGYWASMYEFKVFDGSYSLSAQPNVAMNANDDNSNTYWSAADGNPGHSYAVDLGSVFNVNRTQIEWLVAGNAFKYKIETSTDSLNWLMAVNRTANTSTLQLLTDSFAAVPARYVRVTVTGGTSSGCKAAFSEFRIYDGSVITIKPASVIINCVKPICAGCQADSLMTHPWVNINQNGWKQTDTASVAPGSHLSLSTLVPDTIGWKWRGPNGFSATTATVSLDNVQSRDSGTYVATNGSITVSFKVTLSNNTGLNDLNAARRVILFPNPSKDGVFSVIQSNNSVMSVYNLNGEKVHQLAITAGSQVVNLSFLPTGVYVAKMISDHAVQYVKIAISD